MHKSFIAKEGWPFIAGFALITLLVYLSPFYKFSLIPLVLTLFCLYFFRNPERYFPGERNLVVAPADGRILEINKVYENQYLQSETQQIRIFLNLFNVHINRIPLAGTIEWVDKKGGLCLPAYKQEAGTMNARNSVGLISEYGRILVIQITGIIARRIVCWAKPGDKLQTGERFGIIRFGSCTELYLPLDAKIEVAPGQKVKGGETIIARFEN
ncbi:MAG: phosphatidylserine decarboxylase family protein [Syntrophomonadaceae bacterium]|nr:phosphatidylserine decarboxylase family protein [Syntrophomonadaceae bacterium]